MWPAIQRHKEGQCLALPDAANPFEWDIDCTLISKYQPEYRNPWLAWAKKAIPYEMNIETS